MKPAALRAFRSLHTWTGLVCGWVLFLVFCAGSLTVFRPAIQYWEEPASRHREVQGPAQAQILLERIQVLHPELKGNVSILVPSQEHPQAQAYWFDGPRQAWIIKSLDEMEGPGRETFRQGLAPFLDELHHSLAMGQGGAYVLGGICLLYVLALLAGVMIFLPQMRRRGLGISTHGGGRRFWGDLHGALGLLNLPFHLLFAFTGALFILFMVLVASLDAPLFQRQLAPRMDSLIGLGVEKAPTGVPAPMLPVPVLLDVARTQAPGLEVEALRFHHLGDQGARVEVMGHQSGAVGSWGMLLLDGVRGRVLQRQGSEIMPARFRNSFEKPEALVPNQETEVIFNLQDVLHTFKKGHKIQIQVQSTAYPLFAVNPQKFLENPYKAEKSDYTKAFQKIFNNSVIEVEVLK